MVLTNFQCLLLFPCVWMSNTYQGSICGLWETLVLYPKRNCWWNQRTWVSPVCGELESLLAIFWHLSRPQSKETLLCCGFWTLVLCVPKSRNVHQPYGGVGWLENMDFAHSSSFSQRGHHSLQYKTTHNALLKTQLKHRSPFWSLALARRSMFTAENFLATLAGAPGASVGSIKESLVET